MPRIPFVCVLRACRRNNPPLKADVTPEANDKQPRVPLLTQVKVSEGPSGMAAGLLCPHNLLKLFRAGWRRVNERSTQRWHYCALCFRGPPRVGMRARQMTEDRLCS